MDQASQPERYLSSIRRLEINELVLVVLFLRQRGFVLCSDDQISRRLDAERRMLDDERMMLAVYMHLFCVYHHRGLS